MRGRKYLFTRCCPSRFGNTCRMPHHAACCVLVRDHASDLLVIRLIQNRILIELALALGRLRSQDVAFERVTAFDLARTCLVEALRRSAMCLQLRHSDLSITTYNPRIQLLDGA